MDAVRLTQIFVRPRVLGVCVPMTQDRPPGISITGKIEREWDRSHTPQNTADDTTGTDEDAIHSSGEGAQTRQIGMLRSNGSGQQPIPERLSEKETTEADCQPVIDHYERLLARKNQQLVANGSTKSERRFSTVLRDPIQRLSEYLKRR